MRAYTAVIGHGLGTQLYVGHEPEFAGAHSQGATLDELQADLREVIAIWFEDVAKRSEPSS